MTERDSRYRLLKLLVMESHIFVYVLFRETISYFYDYFSAIFSHTFIYLCFTTCPKQAKVAPFGSMAQFRTFILIRRKAERETDPRFGIDSNDRTYGCAYGDDDGPPGPRIMSGDGPDEEARASCALIKRRLSSQRPKCQSHERVSLHDEIIALSCGYFAAENCRMHVRTRVSVRT